MASVDPSMGLVFDAKAGWARAGAVEIARLWEMVGGEAVGIEHVGSTAVVGLAAGAILDVMIGVEKAERIGVVGELLRGDGFKTESGEVFTKEGKDSVRVQVVEFGGAKWNSAVLLRDYLRHFPEQAARFGEMKQLAAAGSGGDAEKYRQEKSRLMESLALRATTWRNTVSEAAWRGELEQIVSMMREVSKQTDAQAAAALYIQRLREGIVPADASISVSRREMKAPAYRITRSSTWKESVNPWKEKEKLPVFEKGLLGELLYSNEVGVIEDLPSRLKGDDPARAYMEGYELMITFPQYDNGEALNMSVILVKKGDGYAMHRIPVMVWQSNLWGRSVLNSVLREELKEAYDELDKELKVVGELQRSMLPSELPAIPNVNIAAHYQASARAGGDYYDFFKLEQFKWGIFLADVSGQGTRAAVMMAVTHAIAHSFPGAMTPPGRVLGFINEKLTTEYTHGVGTFVTAFYGILDCRRRRLTYSLAGHPGPRLGRKGAVIALEGEPGLPMGLEADEKYPEQMIQLEGGDQLVLFTDGIIEAFDEKGGRYGVERLDRVCAAGAGSAEGLMGEILADLGRFMGGLAAKDDQMLVVVEVDETAEGGHGEGG